MAEGARPRVPGHPGVCPVQPVRLGHRRGDRRGGAPARAGTRAVSGSAGCDRARPRDRGRCRSGPDALSALSPLPAKPAGYRFITDRDPAATILDVPQFGTGGGKLNAACSYWQSYHRARTTAGYSGQGNIRYDDLMIWPVAVLGGLDGQSGLSGDTPLDHDRHRPRGRLPRLRLALPDCPRPALRGPASVARVGRGLSHRRGRADEDAAGPGEGPRGRSCHRLRPRAAPRPLPSRPALYRGLARSGPVAQPLVSRPRPSGKGGRLSPRAPGCPFD